MPRILFIILSDMARMHAGSTPASGLAPPQRRAVSSKQPYAARVQQSLIRYRALASEHESTLRVYSTGDLPDVYEDSFMAVAKPDGQRFHPTLILVCTRLGIDKINQVYTEALISTLQLPQSIGIAG